MATNRAELRKIVKRSYWREADARALLEAWRSSGEPLARFARRHGLDRQRLTRWSKRLEKAPSLVLHPVRLVESRPVLDGVGTGIEIQLVEGPCIRVPRGFATDDLRRVLAVLVEPMPC